MHRVGLDSLSRVDFSIPLGCIRIPDVLESMPIVGVGAWDVIDGGARSDSES